MSKPGHDCVNVVVLIALPEEHDTFLEAFPAVGDVSSAHLVRLSHDLGVDGYTLTSVLAANMGSDLAGSAAYAACEDLMPDLIICLGIAGALADDLNLGDVAVSNEIVDILHNSKVGDRGARGASRPELSPRNYAVDTSLQASCRFLRSHPNLQSHLARWVSGSEERRRDVQERIRGTAVPALEADAAPVFQVGPIVCGPVVISRALVRQLKELNRKVLAVETESGGIFRVCQEKAIPAITIRGISDQADPNKKRLEKTTKNLVRTLAMENATRFFEVLTCNPAFMNVAARHADQRRSGKTVLAQTVGPEEIIRRIECDIERILEEASAEYKNRPSNAPLPLPRIQKLVFDDDTVEVDEKPIPVFDAISTEGNVFIKVARSYPEKTIAWSMAQTLLKHEIDGKQILPLVIEGSRFSPPTLGIDKLTSVAINSAEIQRNFSPVIIINEPPFDSKTKMRHLTSELKRIQNIASVAIITKSDTPIATIDSLKADVGLTDFYTSSVPFTEIAAYLESAFEMCPSEADSVAARLDDTFSKFRLNTHPAYFIGLQESTLSALINANQRAELIELAVSGLLSFIVAADKSAVKLSRTTREEFLRELAYEIRVEKRNFSLSELVGYVGAFAQHKALEIQPLAFLKGFVDIGLLNDASGSVTFSLPFLEAFLLSDKLKSDAGAALRYFDPRQDEFDAYAFDLYCERGADDEVVKSILLFSNEALGECDSDTNVFSAKAVKPAALSTPSALIDMLRSMGSAVGTMTSEPSSDRVRLEKQRLIDARDAVRRRVGARNKQDRSNLAPSRQAELARLDRLSRACTLLATLIGSGAERLSGPVKTKAAEVLLTCSERFLHYWTQSRLKFDFAALRADLLSDEAVDEVIEQFELFDDDREKVRQSLAVFLTDQELRALSGPLATVLHRLSAFAGVRSLKPVLDALRPKDEIENLLKGAWYMDVEATGGKKIIKTALHEYGGSPLFRFVLANHFMWRVFWHHWQLTSRNIFVDVAKSTLKPLGLLAGKEHQRKMLAGHRAQED